MRWSFAEPVQNSGLSPETLSDRTIFIIPVLGYRVQSYFGSSSNSLQFAWRRDRIGVRAHAFQMEFNRLADEVFFLVQRIANQYICGLQRWGVPAISTSARSNSASNLRAASGLRAGYQSNAASYSAAASSCSSIALVGTRQFR
jgi:hypothetical protein